MASAAKVFLMKMCPHFLLKTAVRITRRGRMVRYRAEMLMFPKRAVYYCPCCGLKVRAFVAGSYLDRPERFDPSRYTHTRQDVLCPVCKALPRHRILALWCEDHIAELRSSAILYFAPERCMQLWIKRNGVSCTTADLFRTDTDLRLDVQSTGLPDESYDIIICNHVLEHVDDFRQALKEVYRILREDGFFICSFPMDTKVELLGEDPSMKTSAERIRRFGQNDHKRIFGMKAGRLLEEAGFKVEMIDGKDYPEEILPIIGPADYDMNLLFCCRK